MLADIASGETGVADVLFLVGVILAFLAVILYLFAEPQRPYWSPLVAAAVGCISFGLLLQ